MCTFGNSYNLDGIGNVATKQTKMSRLFKNIVARHWHAYGNVTEYWWQLTGARFNNSCISEQKMQKKYFCLLLGKKSYVRSGWEFSFATQSYLFVRVSLWNCLDVRECHKSNLVCKTQSSAVFVMNRRRCILLLTNWIRAARPLVQVRVTVVCTMQLPRWFRISLARVPCKIFYSCKLL